MKKLPILYEELHNLEVMHQTSNCDVLTWIELSASGVA